MDSRNRCNNINRNTSIFNRIKSRVVRNNLVTPDIFVSEIWMQEDCKNSVEITELNSSNSEVGETTQEPAHNFGQAWGFVNRDRFIDTEEDYRINEVARERWRKKNAEKCFTSVYTHDHDAQTNFNGFNYIDDSSISGITHSDKMNCFTIINNHILNSDSSTDNENARVEEIEPYFTESCNDNKSWDHVYNDEIVTYEPINSEQRTVWIYSFKNKRRLSENDFELVNIPSKDSTDNSSPSEGEINERGTNVCRIASPIPATFIPRLDLSIAQTLSTVTETSEIKNSEESSKESLITKPVFQPMNNWFTERNTHKSKTDASNIINWMALSPRERRRRFKNTFSDSDYDNHNRGETFTHAEGNIHMSPHGLPKDKSGRSPPSVILVDVEVHANDITDTTLADNERASVKSVDLEPKIEKKKVATSIDISYADADTEIEEIGDFNTELFTKPSIKLTSGKTYDVITEPIEKLNSSQWIIEEKDEEETGYADYVFDSKEKIGHKHHRSFDDIDSASKRLWMNYTKLMKSPMWSEYLPIADTPPSSHLSISLSTIEVKKSWFQCIGKYFTCCK